MVFAFQLVAIGIVALIFVVVFCCVISDFGLFVGLCGNCVFTVISSMWRTFKRCRT